MTRYLEPTQARDGAPSNYELQLAHAVEHLFAAGSDSPESLAEGLNDADVPGPGGVPWTAESFRNEMARLGE
ncbi:recombinase-like helix-turn-helix domain-containing protein [Corynebacterium sp.]|uniref:recombinase-like helix-turn-helix domain-containing protein n=1 Tax=Corynebacterium sp. TaxID=1720 RepID=UPI003B3A2C20